MKKILLFVPKIKLRLAVDPLLSLRGFACLMVVMAHSAPPKSTIYFHNYDLTWLIFTAGGVAVRIFFCLSGYLIGKAFYNQRYTAQLIGILNFWRNRALRIFPLYYFAVIILGLIFYPQIWQPENRQYLLRILTFTYDYTLPVDFHGAFWYISTEVQFYLVIPFIYIYLRDRLTKLNQIITLCFSLIFLSFCLRILIWTLIATQTSLPQEQMNSFISYIYIPLITNLDSFICGFLVNAIIIKQKAKQPINQPNKTLIFKAKLAFILIVFLYFFTAYCRYYHQLNLLLIAPTITALLTSTFLYLIESDPYPKSYHFPQKSFWELPFITLGYLGNLSYGIYVWHYPIVTKLTPILFTSNNPLQAFFLRFLETLILSTLLATASYYLIERPAIKLKR
ncbi:acyltransferase [Phormidium sp. LEGE 05292]|uniref:acyltransferase family protein n=1 Tax=[Phormidium] sp. LEGE 05292 TaxID=767427 RepID=UPI0018808CB5|nr:acyltransferase [Phormidium sp. LEGE 05292]MBE9226692.1 acyltransferase [Phormidium sp. LEGE 05292]